MISKLDGTEKDSVTWEKAGVAARMGRGRRKRATYNRLLEVVSRVNHGMVLAMR